MELSNLAGLQWLWLNNNQLTGPVPMEFGGFGELQLLDLTNNTGMNGALPRSLEALRLLRSFWAGGTDLCAPRDADFQRWLAGVRERRVAQCDDGSNSKAYLTQAVQSLDFPVPLVADEDALLRVFVTAENAGSERIPPVRAKFYLGGTEARVLNIPQGTHPIPAEIIEGDLNASANANIPAELVQPGLEVVIEIDPEGTLDPALGVAERIPETGRMGIEVGAMPTLQFTVVPFLWDEAPDSAILELATEMAADPMRHQLLWATRTLLPVRDLEVEHHEPVLTLSNHAYTLAREASAIRAMEGSGHIYLGMMSGSVVGGVAGSDRSYLGGFSMPRPTSVAHTIGHFFALWHAPCGVDPYYGFPDPHFPTEDGAIGAWGYDFREGGSLVPPTQPDLMSGCVSRWISDYHFNKALRYRLANEDASRALAAAPTQSLLLWGGIEADGTPLLEPAFVINAPPTLPQSPGDHEIAGHNSDGDPLFTLRFDLAQAEDGHPESGFAFILPVNPEWADELTTITLSGPSGQATLDGDTDRPMIILRNPQQVLMSRGIPDPEAWRR